MSDILIVAGGVFMMLYISIRVMIGIRRLRTHVGDALLVIEMHQRHLWKTNAPAQMFAEEVAMLREWIAWRSYAGQECLEPLGKWLMHIREPIIAQCDTRGINFRMGCQGILESHVLRNKFDKEVCRHVATTSVSPFIDIIIEAVEEVEQ